MNQEDQNLTPIQWPAGWSNRSRTQRLFENVPFYGSQWLLYQAIKAELRRRTENVLNRWRPFAEDGFNCVEMVLKPIEQAGWPNHFFIPSDDFLLLAAPLGPLDVLNDICVRSGVGHKGKNRWTDFWLYSDCLPRFSDFPEEAYSGTVGELVTYIQELRRQQSVGGDGTPAPQP